MSHCLKVSGLLRHPDIKKGYADDNIIYSFKGRNIDTSKPVKVYRNLNKRGVWYSIRQGNQVVAHGTAFCIRDCKFSVNQKVRKRIVATKKREVHAFIEGYITGSGMGTTSKKNDMPVIIKYNPYLYTHFTTDSGLEIKGARFVICDGTGVKGAYTETNPK